MSDWTEEALLILSNIQDALLPVSVSLDVESALDGIIDLIPAVTGGNKGAMAQAKLRSAQADARKAFLEVQSAKHDLTDLYNAIRTL